MALSEQTLVNVGLLSAELAAAESVDDTERLAALVAACRTVEARALVALSERISQSEILVAQQEALAALGW